MKPLIVGTRGSPLALAQTRLVLADLAPHLGGRSVEVRMIRTEGDEATGRQRSAQSVKALFTGTIETALASGAIDVAVHSLKDLPNESLPGLAIASVPSRADPRDALVTRTPTKAEGLAKGARVGTSSIRRTAQLRAHRPDLVFVDLHGNVETRVRRVDAGDVDATILAVAGLQRLGLDKRITQAFDPKVLLPAPGQGALALQVRTADEETAALVKAVDDAASHACVLAERALSRELGGDCNIPLGALARIEDGRLRLSACVANPGGDHVVRVQGEGPMQEAERIGRDAAGLLLHDGAGPILEAAR